MSGRWREEIGTEPMTFAWQTPVIVVAAAARADAAMDGRVSGASRRRRWPSFVSDSLMRLRRSPIAAFPTRGRFVALCLPTVLFSKDSLSIRS